MVSQWPLVGRSEELQVIADATRASTTGARGIVLSGSAGVGKTRVAREAMARCGSAGARRRWIVGTASARSVPLGAFADVATDFGPDPLRRVREVIGGLVGSAGPGEVIVGIDDAHLLDDLSAFTVHQLVTRGLASVIVTIRSGESPPDAITALWKDQHLERIELQPLSLPETVLLVEHVLDGRMHSLSARQLWQYTQGNALYLRHLLDGELAAGRITRRSGVWLWEGRPEVSPALAELIDAQIGQAPASVRGVLDVLAVSEPMDAEMLGNLSGPDAVAEAESLGLVRVDSSIRPAAVWLAHPLFGEVRSPSPLQLRRLRGRIATELRRKPETDLRFLMRRAMLTADSDLAPDPELFLAAAASAMQVLDLELAENLSRQAVAAGGGFAAKVTLAMTMTWQERGVEAEQILSQLADESTDSLRIQVAILRATNFAVVLSQPASAEGELELLPLDDASLKPIVGAVRASIDATCGRARSAVDRARAVVTDPASDALARMLSFWVLITALGDLGCVEEIAVAADSGYALADSAAEVSHLRLLLAFLQSYAYRLNGALNALDAAIGRIRGDTFDVPLEGGWHTFLAALTAMSRGELGETQRLCHEMLAYLGAEHSGRMIKAFGSSWSVTAAAMAGKAVDARREFETIQWWDEDPDACEWDPERALAEAWVCAAEDAVSQAISIVRHAAALELERGRPAWEVMLLQTATQFGDGTTAPRLAELADQVQGPRASAAAAHAAALAAGRGPALVDASRRYEAFGDRIAAADAAAQAVVVSLRAGLRGAALNAAGTVERLAAECHGAQTPAIRAATTPQPFTDRQREIIALAARGLSNREIADRLTMSVRSVEGHVFRASQRVGANSREQLIAILRGSRA